MPQYYQGQRAQDPNGNTLVYDVKKGWVVQGMGAGPLPVKLSDNEDKQMAALRDTALKSANTDQQVQRFGKLNEMVGTGPIHAGGGWNPINWFNGDKTQAMESITNALAPAQRISGSGSSSDTDVKMFKSGLPSIDKYGKANAQIIDNLHNQAVQDRARVSFYDQWTQQHGTLNGAPEAFQQKLDEIARAPDPQTASALVAALTGQSTQPVKSVVKAPTKTASGATVSNW